MIPLSDSPPARHVRIDSGTKLCAYVAGACSVRNVQARLERRSVHAVQTRLESRSVRNVQARLESRPVHAMQSGMERRPAKNLALMYKLSPYILCPGRIRCILVPLEFELNPSGDSRDQLTLIRKNRTERIVSKESHRKNYTKRIISRESHRRNRTEGIASRKPSRQRASEKNSSRGLRRENRSIQHRTLHIETSISHTTEGRIQACGKLWMKRP